MPDEEEDVKPGEEAESSSDTADVEEESSTPEKDQTTEGEESETGAEASGEPEAEKSDEEKEEPEGEAEDESEEEEDSDESKESADAVPFHNHPRWKQVLSERDSARTESERLKPLATVAESLSKYCKDNDLSNEDVQNALRMVALSKKDVRKFREEMSSYMENLDVSLGLRLPSDIQKKLEDGIIDKATADELAKSRVALQESRQTGRTAEERRMATLQSSVEAALSSWEETLKKGDPSYDKWKDMLQDRLVSLWVARPPQSVQDAIASAEQAKKEVRARFEKWQPRPVKKKAPLSSRGSSVNTGEDFKLDSLDDLGKLVRQVASSHT